MRERYDNDGNIIGTHNMVFDEIPDDYELKQVLLPDKVVDLSYLGVMRHLRDIKAGEEFKDDIFYSSEVISHMALDYLNSARFLWRGIVLDRGKDVVSYYFIPCSFLCKHSIELKLKECLLAKGETKLNGHSVLKLWNEIGVKDIPNKENIEKFLEEVENIDKNEMALRYGIGHDLRPLAEKPKFNVDNLIANTMYLFNVLDEYIICKYRYGEKKS